MVNIVIDGKELTAEPGTMIIEAADNAGINIPRFCYHKKLSIAANCRMCLVEVDKARKPMPACATPITEGMTIFTQSKAAIESQRAVMEFLLINHPLDCPICDQGGECELQDVSMEYGSDVSVYTEGKRSVINPEIGALVATEMTRCIHCTRCVRFGQEIAGIAELGAVGRGEHMEITTYVQKSLTSELSGNIIDLCPVGALTSKPFRFQARTWEMQQYSSVSPHDVLGTNLYINTYEGKVLRVLPRENEAINEVWITDRDRFSYEALNVNSRATQPMVKVDGKWQLVDWDYALNYTLSALQKLVAAYGVEQVGALISPSATLEEMYLLQKLVRGFGGNNIDHRLNEIDYTDQEYLPRMPQLGISIQEVEQLTAVLLVGSNIRKEQPLLAHRLNKAYKDNEAKIYAINPVDSDFIFQLAGNTITDTQGMLYELAVLAKVAIEQGNLDTELEALLSQVQIHQNARDCYDALKNNNHSVIWLGAYAYMHPQASLLRSLARFIADSTQSTWGLLPEGGNAAAGWIAGAIPHRSAGGSVLTEVGYSTSTMLRKQLKGYFLAGIEPELDCNETFIARQAMENAELVISFTSFLTQSIQDNAHIILPIAAFSESAGTYINTQGDWQTVKGVTSPSGEARPLWKILRVLGTLLELKGFNYDSLAEVTHEIKQLVEKLPKQDDLPVFINCNWAKPSKSQMNRYTLVKAKGIYSVDMLVRNALSLQDTPEAKSQKVAVIHPQLAESLELVEGQKIKVIHEDREVILDVVINKKSVKNCVIVGGGILETMSLGACYSEIKIERV